MSKRKCEIHGLNMEIHGASEKMMKLRYLNFIDMKVKAVPYDSPIIGYGNKNINTLRLWKCEAIRRI